LGKDVTLALRSFLVFLHVDGVLAQSLAGAVPRVAGWRLAGLPRPLDPGVARQLVGSCDLGGVIGRRDRAILLLLWRLALRRGEVAAMMLDDLDWRAGGLRVCGKSRRVEVLPLPWDVGEALAEYVRDDRPRVKGRAVFVAVNAPHGPLASATVSRVVADAARRAGVSGVTAHRLRHGGDGDAARGRVADRDRPGAAPPTDADHSDLRERRCRDAAIGGSRVAQRRVMTSLHEALTDYLRIRRGEGVKFEKIGLALEHFVEFLEERGAERVTVELAVEWATLSTQASDMHRANRLTMVRGFAAYLRERNLANEVPPWGLLPSVKPRTGRPRRRPVDTAPCWFARRAG
jgi:hypothetical protein